MHNFIANQVLSRFLLFVLGLCIAIAGAIAPERTIDALQRGL
jgi:hypothetical protein